MNEFKSTILKCKRLDVEIPAMKKFAIIPDGNSLHNYKEFVENICNNEKNCPYYKKCKISDFEPIN